MTPAEARQQFQRIVRLPDERIDLAEAALWVAAEEYADLDVGACLARLDRLAEAARPAVWGAADPRERLLELVRFVHVSQRFAGNRSDYYDARNSYLNEVLERRTGIPITSMATNVRSSSPAPGWLRIPRSLRTSRSPTGRRSRWAC